MRIDLLIPTLLAQTGGRPDASPAPASAPAGPASRQPEVLSWAEATFLSNTAWQWLGLLGVLLAGLVVGKIVAFALARQADRLKEGQRLPLLSMLLASLAGPIKLIALAAGLYAASLFMSFQPNVLDFWLKASSAVGVLAAGWFIFRLVDVVEYYLKRLTSRTETQLDDQLVPLIRKTLRIFVVIVVVLFIAQNVFDWQIGPLIAGLGIGGLAFALAAKDTIANFFGSVTIFADRPFQLGERVKVQGHEGAVEEVGFRSTRIRTLMGHLVTIPNSMIATEAVENVSRRPYIKRVLNVTVTYDTPPEKVRRGVEILKDMLAARMAHFPEDLPPRVYFSDFNATSLNIVVYYWFAPPDWWEYLAFTHEFNTELLRRFNDEGIEFAFPTQTLYLKQDSDLAADLRLAERPKN